MQDDADTLRREAQEHFNEGFGWLAKARDGLPVMVHWSHTGPARGPYRVRRCAGRIWLQVDEWARQDRTVIAHSLLSINDVDRITALEDDGLEMACRVRVMTQAEIRRQYVAECRNLGIDLLD